MLLCIQTGKTMQDENRMRMQTEEFYLKSPEQMAALFPQIPEAAANTVRIAERCQVEMEFGKLHLPEFQVEGDPYDYLLHLCRQGLAERYPEADSAVLERMDYELGVIRQMGYVDYFLIVWDFIRFAREQGIVVGPGRAAPRAASWPTCCTSPTSTRSSISCSLSASSTRSASACPISTSTSATSGGARSLTMSSASTAPTG